MLNIVQTNLSYQVTFPFKYEVKDAVKSVPGARWNPVDKYWSLPLDRQIDVQLLIGKFGGAVTVNNNATFSNLPELPDLTIDIPLKRPLFPYQAKGVAQGLKYKCFINGDEPGLGKGQLLSARLPTPDGWIKMKDVQIGTKVFCSNGKATEVIGVFPQGIKPVYKITFNDGYSTDCDDSHLWVVRDQNRRRKYGTWTVKTTTDLINSGVANKQNENRRASGRKPSLKWEIPVAEPVEYTTASFIVDPYIMGVLLGDGSLTGEKTSFSTPDFDYSIVERVATLLPSNLKLYANRYAACPYYSITQTSTTNKNPFKAELSEIGICVKSKEKFIPKKYLFGDVQQRKELLKGLMDTDGSCIKNRSVYHTLSYQLATDVVELVQSLGGLAKIRTYDRTDENKGLEYQVNINTTFCPFHLDRKGKEWRKCIVSRYIQSIEYLREDYTQCIKVGDPDETYLTDYFIVTHNTSQAIATVIAAQCKCVLVICPATLKLNWQREFEIVAGRRSIILTPAVKNTWMQYHKVGMCSVFITNYESLKTYFVESIHKPEDRPFTLKDIKFKDTITVFDAVIIDELHKCKETKTLQSKLTKGICAGKEYIIGLTGTPVVNKPRDLISQLGIINRLHVVGGYKTFMNRYCGRDGKGAENLAELNYVLNTTCFFKRRKKDVLKELPDKTYQVVTCDITTRKEYDDAIKDLSIYLQKWKNKSDAEVEKSLRGEIMVRIGVCKSISARGKLNETFEQIDEVIESGEKIVVFIHQKEIALHIMKRYPNAVTVRGDDSNDTRDRNVRTFQNDPKVAIIICSIKAAGVGLTLTASSRVLFVELPWHAADVEQCVDRTHRIGQKNAVLAKFLLGGNTIDEYIYKLIESKRGVANEVTGTVDDVQREIIDKLAESLFNVKNMNENEEKMVSHLQKI